MRKLSLVLALAAPLAALAVPAAKADTYWGAPPPAWGSGAPPAWRQAPPAYGHYWAPGRPSWDRHYAVPSYPTRFVPGHWAYDHRGRVWVPPRRW